VATTAPHSCYTAKVLLHYLQVQAGSQYQHGAWEWDQLQVVAKGVDVCLEENQCYEAEYYKNRVYHPGVDRNTKHGGLGCVWVCGCAFVCVFVCLCFVCMCLCLCVCLCVECVCVCVYVLDAGSQFYRDY